MVPPNLHRRLLDAPGMPVTIDLEKCSVTLADGTTATFPIDPFSRYCLLNGLDELSFLLKAEEAITAFERTHS
jgi:3-isopropylmalate/(R)-2-methylmalate dehydratase small subunit